MQYKLKFIRHLLIWLLLDLAQDSEVFITILYFSGIGRRTGSGRLLGCGGGDGFSGMTIIPAIATLVLASEWKILFWTFSLLLVSLYIHSYNIKHVSLFSHYHFTLYMYIRFMLTMCCFNKHSVIVT